jgi:hypothetical protein
MTRIEVSIMSGSNRSLFSPGRVVATPGALEALEASGETPAAFLDRHLAGDWGDLDREDKRANDLAVATEGKPEEQGRVFSAYHTSQDVKLWVITEWDRSVTTLLLPNEY